MNGEWQEDGYVNIAFGGVELLWTGSTLSFRILMEILGWTLRRTNGGASLLPCSACVF